MPIIGPHLHDGDPLTEATALGANAVQFFLGDPQDWRAPSLPGGRQPDQIRADFEAAGVVAYIHAPYVMNVASPNNRIRIPSRKILEQQLNAAASIGAAGLIVHGGHVTVDTDPAEGYESWRKAIERIHRPLPMLIENTAGGDGAMARILDNLARRWDGFGDASADVHSPVVLGNSHDHGQFSAIIVDKCPWIELHQAGGQHRPARLDVRRARQRDGRRQARRARGLLA